MKQTGRAVLFLLSVVCLVLVTYDRAYAYIDPSSGSYFLQLLLAGLLSALFMLRMYWRRVKSFLLNLLSRSRRAEGHD